MSNSGDRVEQPGYDKLPWTLTEVVISTFLLLIAMVVIFGFFIMIGTLPSEVPMVMI